MNQLAGQYLQIFHSMQQKGNLIITEEYTVLKCCAKNYKMTHYEKKETMKRKK